jgi:hypothetical protein
MSCRTKRQHDSASGGNLPRVKQWIREGSCHEETELSSNPRGPQAA